MSGDNTTNNTGASLEMPPPRRSRRSAAMLPPVDTVAPTSSLPAPSPTSGPKTRFQREQDFTSTLRRDGVADISSSPFVANMMQELQQTFDRHATPSDGNTSSPDETQAVKVRCHKLGLYALRRICTGWSLLPVVGGRRNGETITPTDYSFAAHKSIESKDYKALGWLIAKLMGRFVNPNDIDYEATPRSQQRVDECILAMKKQYLIWQTNMLDDGTFLAYENDDATLSEDEVELTSYDYQLATGTPSEPTRPAYLMGTEGLTAAAKDEGHDSIHIIATDNDGQQMVLKTKPQKHSYLIDQLVVTRAAEAAEESRQKEASKARKAATAKTRKDASSSPDQQVVNTKGSKRKRAAVGPGNDADGLNDADMTQLSGGKTKAKRRKTNPTPPSDPQTAIADDAEENGDATPSKRRTKKSAMKKPSSERKKTSAPPNSNGAPDGPTSNDTVAPSTKGLGGAAPTWLKDEDDLGHNLIFTRPDLTIPEIYREWAPLVANTAYQTADMEAPAYRSDYVRFDRAPTGMNDAESRQYDISWRSFEAVKQHLEPFRTWLRRSDEDRAARPFERRLYPRNLASHLPKRAPPPRPTFFSDGKTPVPRLPGSSTVAPTILSASKAPAQSQGTTSVATNGWTPINATPDFAPYQPPPPATKRTTRSGVRNRGNADNTSTQKQLKWVEPVTPASSKHSGRQTSSPAQQLEEANTEAQSGLYTWPENLPPTGQPGPADDQFNDLEEWNTWMSDGEDEEASHNGLATALGGSEGLETTRALQRAYDVEAPQPAQPERTTKRRSAGKASSRTKKQASPEEDLEDPPQRPAPIDPFMAAVELGNQYRERVRNEARNASTHTSRGDRRVDTPEEARRKKLEMINNNSFTHPMGARALAAEAAHPTQAGNAQATETTHPTQSVSATASLPLTQAESGAAQQTTTAVQESIDAMDQMEQAGLGAEVQAELGLRQAAGEHNDDDEDFHDEGSDADMDTE